LQLNHKAAYTVLGHQRGNPNWNLQNSEL
jgi:hypothetical protein